MRGQSEMECKEMPKKCTWPVSYLYLCSFKQVFLKPEFFDDFPRTYFILYNDLYKRTYFGRHTWKESNASTELCELLCAFEDLNLDIRESR